MHYTLTILLPLALTFTPLGAHEHRAVGATTPGSPLRILGPDGTAKLHLLRPRGRAAGPRPQGNHPELRGGGFYYLDERVRQIYDAQGHPLFDNEGDAVVAGEGFSFTALSADPDFPEPGHAHPGASIACEILSVTGPPGAQFGFWDAERSYYGDSPTYSFAVGQPTGSPRFAISEGVSTVDSDPYGHIHDRAWSADKPGDYIVMLRFIDISTNRPGGNPWHLPSVPYVYRFKAGPDFTPVGKLVPGSGFTLTWPSQMGISATAFPAETGVIFKILRSTELAPQSWFPIGEVTGAPTSTVTFTDPSPPLAKAFYKLAYDWSSNTN